MRSLPWFFALVLGAGVAGACANNSSSPTSGTDGSTTRRDSGPRDNADCGEIGNRCCQESSPSCRGGEDQALCVSGTCCAVPNGARCERSSDCCGGKRCGSDRRCCSDPGDRCDSNAECCDGVCTSAGVCGSSECDYRDCDQCLDNGCGWCNGSCRGGDSRGPAVGSCSGDWLFGTGDIAACPDSGDCSGASSCDACLQVEGSCGWCGDRATGGTCERGLTGGPDVGDCSSTWSWTAAHCNMLESHCTATNCGSCLDQAGCGWCNSTGRCQGSQGSCSDWAERDAECDQGSNSCTDSTCQDCIHDNCGWCGSSNTSGTCQPGSEPGPDDGSCSSNWVWSASSCDNGGTTSCSGSTCGTCLGTNCGWCTDNDRCLPGSSSGPSTSSACSSSGWVYYSNDCPSSSNCGSATRCDTCNGISGCGWCADDNRCRPLSESSSCSTRGWKDEPFECCENHSSSCTGCTDLLPCGWCESNNSCMEGSSTQSDNGSCSGSNWVWNNADCDGGSGGTCSSSVTGACSSDSDCCDTANVNLSCREGVSFPTRCCMEQGSDCSDSAHCCGWMICYAGQCKCQQSGESCLDGRDCCSGLSCVGGSCIST